MRHCSSSVPAIARSSERSGQRTIGTNWIVTGGLAPGEKVITQGTANLKDGAQIKAGAGGARRSGSRRRSPEALKKMQANRRGGSGG